MLSYWEIPQVWKGQTAFVIGGGASLTPYRREVICEELYDQNVITCNDGYMLGNFFRYNTFADNRWYKEHLDRIEEVKHCFFIHFCNGIKHPEVNTVHRVPHDYPTGADEIRWYRNTGLTSVMLALKMGASRVIMLGFDNKRVDNQTNWYENLAPPSNNIYNLYTRGANELKQDIDSHFPDAHVINANMDSGFTIFPKCSFDGGIDCAH